VIEISPFRNGWKSCEGREVEPVFGTQEEAVGMPRCAHVFVLVSIVIIDSSGRIERVIPFNDTERKM